MGTGVCARVSPCVEFLHAWQRKSSALPPLHLSSMLRLRRCVEAIYLAWCRSSVWQRTDWPHRKTARSLNIPVPLVLLSAFLPARFPHRVPTTFLCLQVRRATEAIQRLCQCPSEKCSKLNVRKVGEGRYHIAGRNVFIRVCFQCHTNWEIYMPSIINVHCWYSDLHKFPSTYCRASWKSVFYNLRISSTSTFSRKSRDLSWDFCPSFSLFLSSLFRNVTKPCKRASS